MRVSFNIEKVKTLSEHQPDRDEEDRRGNDRCSRGNPGPQDDRHESQAQRTSSMDGPQIPSSCCGSPAATDSTPVNMPILLLPYARRWVCRYCVDGVDRAASPVAGKGLTLSHGWRTV